MIDPTSLFCPLTLESKKDAIARALAQAIAKRDQSIEHGAFIIRDSSGNIVSTRIIEGGTNYVNPAEALQVLRSSGFNESQVVGFIHYHTPPASSINRAPSWDGNLTYSWANPGNNDYAFSARISREAVETYGANQSAFNAEFTNYIIDANGNLYEWDGVAPHSAVQDGTITNAEAELASKDAQSRC